MSELESCGEFRFSHEVRAHPLAEVMREINRLQMVIAQRVAHQMMVMSKLIWLIGRWCLESHAPK